MNTYLITYRKNGQQFSESRRGENFYDVAVRCKEANGLKSKDILSNVLKSKGRKGGTEENTMPPKSIGRGGNKQIADCE